MPSFALSLPKPLERWLAEPPPHHVFEITERSLAVVSPAEPEKGVLEMLPERGLTASPSTPNITQSSEYRDALVRLAGTAHGRRRTAALVIPDYAVRMAVLDFQEFPAGEPERDALLRFRLRKSVPFHIEEAQVSYSIQLTEANHMEVLAVAIARPILAEYEDIIAAAGFRIGLVAPSSIAALPLFVRTVLAMEKKSARSLTLVAKLAGSIMTVLLLQESHIRVVRCLDLASEGSPLLDWDAASESILDLLQQTAAYAEDLIGQPIDRLLVCGWGSEGETLAQTIDRDWDVRCRPVLSRFGNPSQEDAGLLGLLEQYAA